MTFDRRLFLHASLLSALAGCARQGPYRTESARCYTNSAVLQECRDRSYIVAKLASAPNLEYSLSVVEFDDQGVLLSENAMWVACNQLKEVSASGRELSIVIYVHGWHHNADDDDADFASFNELLAALAALEATKPTNRYVTGIYAAWPGLSITVPGVKYAGFWTRKETAERVAQGSILELFAQVRQIWKSQRDDNGDPRLVIIGHSFGGLIVYQALRNYFIEGATTGPTHSITRAQKQVDPILNQKIEGYGNLVILVNPAFEGVRYEVINRIVNERDQFHQKQKPVLAIFAARNDYPVRYFFPIGRWLGTGLQQAASVDGDRAREQINERPTDQLTKLVYGVGYVDEFATHRLDLRTPPNPRFVNTAAMKLDPEVLREREAYEMEQLEVFERTWIANGTLKKKWERVYTDGAVLTHTAKYPTNPFWVVKVDSALIDGHNGIWDNPQWMDFLRQFFDETVDRPEVSAKLT
ncbi:MAG: hypothetical protein WAS21_23240 [Geminicoccaceae bacterium]